MINIGNKKHVNLTNKLHVTHVALFIASTNTKYCTKKLVVVQVAQSLTYTASSVATMAYNS